MAAKIIIFLLLRFIIIPNKKGKLIYELALLIEI